MPSKLSRHPSPPKPPDFLLVSQPEAVPWIDELELRYDALLKLKSKHLERARHAMDNMRASEEEIKRIKDREKGKARAIEKIKRERDCACVSHNLLREAH